LFRPETSVPTVDQIRHYEEKLGREPNCQAFAALGEAYRRAGRLDEAIEVCRRGLAQHPGYETTRFVLAKAIRDRGDVDEAWMEVRRFLEREAEHEPALHLAVECALRRADPQGALACLQRLSALDPGDRVAQGQLRALETAAGLRRAPTEDGGLWPLFADDTFSTVTFGDLCLDQGLHDEATAVFARIILRTPDHDIARARLGQLGLARIEKRRVRG
jgi:tetratricopeptide (TPR) repeat protein